MNIFVLSFNPGQAAQALCDKHVPKMVLETAQLLCSPFEPGVAPYKRTHYNHPCAKWVREDIDNYSWLMTYAIVLGVEYRSRFGRDHKSMEAVHWCGQNASKLPFQNSLVLGGMTTEWWKRNITKPAQAMPDKYKHHNPVTAYRAYYIGEKARFAKWERGRKPPRWWPKET